MRRRRFITLLGGVAMFIPLSAWAQQPQPPLIGVLNAASAESNVASYEAFRAQLRQLGYVERRNIRFEYRYADGFLDRLPTLVEELIRLNPSVIVSGPLPASLAARKATATIPIVMATGADPVGFGLVQSLSHLGGNATVEFCRGAGIEAARCDPRIAARPFTRGGAHQRHEPAACAAMAGDTGRHREGVAVIGAFRIPRARRSGAGLRRIREREGRGPSGAA